MTTRGHSLSRRRDAASSPALPPHWSPRTPLVPVSLAATLTKAEIDQQIATAHNWPRSPARACARHDDLLLATSTTRKWPRNASIPSPEAAKQIRGPSIRHAEIVLSAWGNVEVRCPRHPRGPYRALR